MSQVKIGKVVSNKMSKTIVVVVETHVRHPLYKKMITKTKNFKVHNELELKVGDKVKIAETRPISKHVHFKTVEVVK